MEPIESVIKSTFGLLEVARREDLVVGVGVWVTGFSKLVLEEESSGEAVKGSYMDELGRKAGSDERVEGDKEEDRDDICF